MTSNKDSLYFTNLRDRLQKRPRLGFASRGFLIFEIQRSLFGVSVMRTALQAGLRPAAKRVDNTPPVVAVTPFHVTSFAVF